MEDLEKLVDQLIDSLNKLKEADEKKDPVDTWNYDSDELQERREMFDFRCLQVKERAKRLIEIL